MSDLRIQSGECWIHLAFDAASAIDLEEAESTLVASRRALGAGEMLDEAVPSRESISDSKRTPPGIQFRPKPLRLVRRTKAIPIGETGRQTEPEAELTLYDFGAISVAYRVSCAGASLEELRLLSIQLADSKSIQAAARAQVDRVLSELGALAVRASVADPVEDHLVFHIRDGRVGGAPMEARSLDAFAPQLAQVLRAANEPLSDSEIVDAHACTISYGHHDRAIIDWYAAIIFEPDERSAADLLAVLEFANVELVELRFLDDRLDGVLDRAYRAVWMGGGASRSMRPGWLGLWRRGADREQRRLAALQMDSALLFEGINNAIKLLGDQYLARVYRLAARRFHLVEWDAAILRKLETLERLYQKSSDIQSTRRMEILEWIIIILIALSIVIVFVPGAK